MEHNSWGNSIRRVIWGRAKKYVAEVCGGGIIGLFIGWDWIFARVNPTLVADLLAVVILLKGVLCSALSAVASTYVSHLFKKHILKIDQNEPPTQKRGRGEKRKRA